MALPKRKYYKGNSNRQKWFFSHPLLWKQGFQAIENNRAWGFYEQISESHVNSITQQLLLDIRDSSISECCPFHQTVYISNCFSTYWANLWSSNSAFWALLMFHVQRSMEGFYCNKKVGFFFFLKLEALAHFWKSTFLGKKNLKNCSIG